MKTLNFKNNNSNNEKNSKKVVISETPCVNYFKSYNHDVEYSDKPITMIEKDNPNKIAVNTFKPNSKAVQTSFTTTKNDKKDSYEHIKSNLMDKINVQMKVADKNQKIQYSKYIYPE